MAGELWPGFYLATKEGPMAVKLIDGVHSEPRGVAQAAKLHRRIFAADDAFVMVEVTDVPDEDVPINEDAADVCADLLAGRLPPGSSGGTPSMRPRAATP